MWLNCDGGAEYKGVAIFDQCAAILKTVIDKDILYLLQKWSIDAPVMGEAARFRNDCWVAKNPWWV